MLTKADFTAEEWNVIRRAPFMAFAVGKTLANVKLHGASSDLVKAVTADLETAEARQQSTPTELQGKTPDQVRTAALEACRQAAAVLEKKAKPDEAQAFKQWLLSLGQRVAEAAKEGGILGIGGTRVSAQETAALNDLSSVLSIKA